MKKHLVLLAILGITVTANAATPTISSVTGTVSTGQMLTVTGTNMVQENTTNWAVPLAQAYGTGTSPAADGWMPMGTGMNYVSNVGVTISAPVVIGTKALHSRLTINQADNNASVAGNQNGISGTYNYRYNNIGPTQYFRTYVMYDANNTDLWLANKNPASPSLNGYNPYIKQLYWMTNSVYVDMGGDGQGWPKTPDIKLYTTSPTNPQFPEQLKPNKWYCLEATSTYNSANATVGTQLWMDGKYLGSFTGSVSGSYATNPSEFNLGYVNAAPWSNLGTYDAYYAGATISSSRIYPASVVEISNNSIYGAGIIKYQEPVYLSDGSLQIKVDLTGLGSEPYYLWVTNNGQTRSVPYNLSAGNVPPITSGDTTPPVISNSTPAGILSAGITTTTASITTNEVATCKYSSSPGVTYSAMTNTFSTTGSTNHNFAANGLVDGSTYNYYVRCIDSSGNADTIDYPLSFSVASTPGGSSTILFQEKFDDNSFTARGWYDNTNHGTIVSNGKSGNALEWAWTQGGTKPVNGGSMRKLINPTDSLYVSFYVKFQSGWQGSQKTYHPHLITIPSNLDAEYAPLAENYLNTYIEFISDVGSPYAIRPLLAIQDSLRVNTTLGTPPNNLAAITENRSVAYCNTSLPSGVTGGCYDSGGWYSANVWKSPIATVPTSTWHKVEVYFKMNTIVGSIGQSNGIMTKWIDGVKVIDRSDVLYRTNQDATKKWAQFVLSPWIGDGSPITQTMWIDELTVATLPPSTSSINMPAGLKIKAVTPN